MLVVNRHAQGLAHQHGDGDLGLVAAGGVDRAARRSVVADDLANLLGQIAQALGPKPLGVLVLKVGNRPGLGHRVAEIAEIPGQDAADRVAVGGVGVAEDEVRVGGGILLADQAGQRVDLGAAEPLGRFELQQPGRDRGPVPGRECRGQALLFGSGSSVFRPARLGLNRLVPTVQMTV